MVRAIFGAILFLALALLVLLNSSYTTSFNLFGKVYPNVPLVMVVLASFFAGVCYVVLLYMYSKLRKWGKSRKLPKGKEPVPPAKEELFPPSGTSS